VIRRGAREIAAGATRLREVTRDDARFLHRLRSDDATRGAFRTPGPIPFADHLRFIERYFASDNHDRWFVVEHAGEAVGTIALYDLSDDARTAAWGRFAIAPERRGRGIGAAALGLLLEHARDLGVRRLRCEVLAANQPADTLYRRLGFVAVGAELHDGRLFVQLEKRLDERP
jgi:RimJ/RimL family protein N-acetyltransferase